MRTGVPVVLLALAMLVGVGGCTSSGDDGGPKQPADGSRWEFAPTADGNVQTGWVLMQTNPTNAWAMIKVVDDVSAPSPPSVLAVVESTCSGNTFNLAIAGGVRYGDLSLSVMVKAVSGTEDQGGGPVWRCRDQNNYYICRFNPLESNFRVYCVTNGQRKQLASADIDLQTARWYEVGVTMRGVDIVCSLDGSELLKVRDETLADAGFVGVWAKADAITSFDDLIVQSLD